MWWVVRIFLCRFVYLPWFSVVAVQVVRCSVRQSSSNSYHMLCHKNFTCTKYICEMDTAEWTQNDTRTHSSTRVTRPMQNVWRWRLWICWHWGFSWFLAHGTKRKLFAAFKHGALSVALCHALYVRTELNVSYRSGSWNYFWSQTKNPLEQYLRCQQQYQVHIYR